MTIEVSIRAESAEEYRNAIKALMDGAGLVGFEIPDGLLANSAPVPSAVEMSIKAEKPTEKPTEKPAATKEETTAKPVTLEDLQTTGRKLALAGKQDKLGEILGKYSVRKLSDIPSEHWAEALNEMEVNLNG